MASKQGEGRASGLPGWTAVFQSWLKADFLCRTHNRHTTSNALSLPCPIQGQARQNHHTHVTKRPSVEQGKAQLKLKLFVFVVSAFEVRALSLFWQARFLSSGVAFVYPFNHHQATLVPRKGIV